MHPLHHMTNANRHRYSESGTVAAAPDALFAYLDDHARLSAHMGKSSWMMGGGSMKTETDDGRGQRVGSHITMSGSAFGMRLSLDEAVTRYEPPRRKEWETVGTPRLLVIGRYRMGIEIAPHGAASTLRVYIEYDLPATHAWFGRAFGRTYAKWCVRQMLRDAQRHFAGRS